MALDFPSNPTNGQLDATGNWKWNATKGVWQSIAQTITPTIVSPTKPLSGTNGDLWFNTTDGTMFVYYDDGSGSPSAQWVQVKANSALEASYATRLAVLESTLTFPIQLNTQTISSSYALPAGYNGISAGPITIADGVTVTVPDGQSWSIV